MSGLGGTSEWVGGYYILNGKELVTTYYLLWIILLFRTRTRARAHIDDVCR